jgi:hypothetical protein
MAAIRSSDPGTGRPVESLLRRSLPERVEGIHSEHLHYTPIFRVKHELDIRHCSSVWVYGITTRHRLPLSWGSIVYRVTIYCCCPEGRRVLEPEQASGFSHDSLRSAHAAAHYPNDRRFRIWVRPSILIGIGAPVLAAVLAAWIEIAIAGLPAVPPVPQIYPNNLA